MCPAPPPAHPPHGPRHQVTGTSPILPERRDLASSKYYLPSLPTDHEANRPRNSHQLVTLYAGQQEEAKSFLIHKDFACHYSPVLKAALNSNFVEGQTQSYRLDEENGEAVRLLIHCMWEISCSYYLLSHDSRWRLPRFVLTRFCDEYLLICHYPGLYTQMLDTQQPEERLIGDPKKDEDRALVQLWILADKLIIPELQNLVIGKIDEICEVTEIIPTAVLDSVYAKTSVESSLRRWFFYQCSTQLDSDWFTEHPEHFPLEMLIELAAFWSRFMTVQDKVGFMKKTSITDFEVELTDE